MTVAKNSRQKGKRGELLWRDELRKMGFEARRGQQFAGGGDSPDVVCPSLPRLHCEVKMVAAMDLGTKLLDDAINQAKADAGEYIGHDGFSTTLTIYNPHYVAWKPPRKDWRITYPCPWSGHYVTVTGTEAIKSVLVKLNGGGQ